jgi:hypothetical protein
MIESPSVEIPPAPSWFRKLTRTTDAAEFAAERYGLNPDDVEALMPDAYAQLKHERDLWNNARKRACQMTGLNALRCNQWEDSGRDFSTRYGFDCSAREIADEHPELAIDRNSHDVPALIWELIKRGAPAPLLKSSPEVALLAAQWLWSASPAEETTDDDLDCSFNPEEWCDPVPVEAIPVMMESDGDDDRTANNDHIARRDVRVRMPGYRPIVRHENRCVYCGGLSPSVPLPPLRLVTVAAQVPGSARCRIHQIRGHPATTV